MPNPKLKVQEVATDSLVPYAGNAKEHPEWQVEQIATSISEFGFNDPIGVWHNADGTPIIVEGHGRLMAAKELGMKKVPVVFLDHLDDEARRAYTLVHNQLTTNTGYDYEVLASELSSLGNFDMGAYGFDEDTSLEDYDYVEEVDIPDDVEARVQPGEVWVLGNHRLICGDSTDPETVKKLMAGAQADMLLTDPPYGVDYVSKNIAVNLAWHRGNVGKKSTVWKSDIKGDDLDRSNLLAFLIAAFKSAFENMRAGAAYYIWYASVNADLFAEALAECEARYREELVWVKQRLNFGRQDYHYQHEPCLYGWKPGAAHWFAPTRCEVGVFDSEKPYEKYSKAELVNMMYELKNEYETSVLRYSRTGRNELHPTMKPVELFAHLIRNSSKKGENVLDIFAGSGTTVIACEQMGRHAYVVEYDPHYCDVIIARWEEFTGKKAEKED